MSGEKVPKDGLAGLRENWKSDLASGFVIFLIALPLCLGISLASGAPPMAGLFSGIMGGLVVSLFSGSYVTINGPAAGLIAVVLHSITTLGAGDARLGFEYTLAVIVIAGAIQVVLGLVRAGNLTVFFPISVIHGMMSAIGIIIIAKQFYIALGINPESKTIGGLILEIPFSLDKINPEVATIGISAILVLVLLSFSKNAFLKKLPAPLVAVVIGVVLGIYFDLEDEHSYTLLDHTYKIGPASLVTLPAHITDGIITPNFSLAGTGIFWVMVVTIALIGSIESLLTASAIDKVDPYRRQSNMNQELVAKGFGNFILGWIGGLPIIAEVVRSSANISNGAKTRWSNFFHGFLLLIFIVLLPGLIHKIPLASLAGVLIMVGVRLTSPKEFIHAYQKGWDQIVVFLVTIFFTIFEDLLVGVAAGILTKLIIQLAFGVPFKNLFFSHVEMKEEGNQITLRIKKALIFSNLLSVKRVLLKLPLGKSIRISCEDIKFVGYSALDFLNDFKNDYERDGGEVVISGVADLVPISNHPQASRRHI
ncbi:SulP family inorganic anion transporter [Leptospira idonii]|uniref:SulP family inorganic anion transporter n=1 Tax=Leptospira idonii TaxID=1193500 RepID=A0A4R9LWH3_9LEPT|nr:SulP family inorganic anion transporter [Leptospira idonii]TGN17307.1 SulP family inorganic anion transporter [Leptospira idonii]